MSSLRNVSFGRGERTPKKRHRLALLPSASAPHPDTNSGPPRPAREVRAARRPVVRCTAHTQKPGGREFYPRAKNADEGRDRCAPRPAISKTGIGRGAGERPRMRPRDYAKKICLRHAALPVRVDLQERSRSHVITKPRAGRMVRCSRSGTSSRPSSRVMRGAESESCASRRPSSPWSGKFRPGRAGKEASLPRFKKDAEKSGPNARGARAAKGPAGHKPTGTPPHSSVLGWRTAVSRRSRSVSVAHAATSTGGSSQVQTRRRRARAIDSTPRRRFKVQNAKLLSR